MVTQTAGMDMYALAQKLFPVGRSLTGNGVRETLRMLQERIPLTVHEVPTGTQAFDWTVPKEWNIKEAYITDPNGNRIAEYAVNNLHVVGYSVPVDKNMTLAELQEHLHSLESEPDAIPYVTSYYAERWGFCMTHNERRALKEGTYRAYIDAELKNGSLTYGELVIPGSSKQEVLLSTYVCHPSMANNELSGPVLAAELAWWLMAAPRKYTYRIVFIPETIGSLVYLSKYLDHLKKHTVAGFVLTCVGDERGYSFIPSRTGDTLADRVALRVLRATHPDFKHWSYLDRGSDERNYCSPGADLPVVSVMRSRYGTYPEYHTSKDDLSLITPAGLQGSFDLHKKIIETLERSPLYRAAHVGEPQLGKRGLMGTLSHAGSVGEEPLLLVHLLAYADGTRHLEDIAEIVQKTPEELQPIVAQLLKHGLLVVL